MNHNNDEHRYDDIINLPHHQSKKRSHMSLHDRAAQFAPFSALSGLSAKLAEKERITVDKIDLTEEQAEKLSNKLNQVERGMHICAVHYLNGEYIPAEGIVTSIDITFRKLTIEKTEIDFDDLLDISGEDIMEEE